MVVLVLQLALADERAEQLAALRTEVAQLSSELAVERESLRGQLRALDVERAELQGQTRRETLRQSELHAALAAKRDELAVNDEASDGLRPVVLAGLDELEAAVRDGLPYRTDDRLAAIEELRGGLLDGDLRPEKALGRSWALVEDELRLTRETALDRQVVALPTGNERVEVARVGMVALYARRADGQFLRATRSAHGWSWTDVPESEPVANLFDALSKQVRSGWFPLPDLAAEVSR